MEALPKELAEAYRQRLFMYCSIVLDVARIIHVQDCYHEKADGNARRECEPRPARNLHVIGSPRHQKSHRDVDQHITQTANGELERPGAIEISYRHTCQSKENN